MKTLKLICFITALVITFSSSAQDGPVYSKAMGLRLESGTIQGAELSFQSELTNTNRLQFDLGWAMNHNNDFTTLGLTSTYQWVKAIGEGTGFQYYYGPGAAIGFWGYNRDRIEEHGLFFGIGGIAGIEYKFYSAPIHVSLDIRPILDILGMRSEYNHYGNLGGGLALRYMF